MTDEQTKLISWFQRQFYLGKNYDQALQTLLDTRKIGVLPDKEEVQMYNIFVYLSDNEWREVKNIIFQHNY